MTNNPDNLTAKDIADALEGKRHGNHWKASCPAHDDGTPSLSIREGENGTVIVYCHACRDQKVVIAALRDRGLWPDRRHNGKARRQSTIVTSYDYQDEDGNLIFRSVRKKPKTFFQQQPDGNGGWIDNVKGVPKYPYLYPEIVEAIAQGKPIFIVEGEKDCDNLAALNIPATTNAGGAGKWTIDHANFLKAASEPCGEEKVVIIILPDNDDPGRKHADAVAASLKGIAKSIRIVELPDLKPKGDISDWIADGATAEDLWALVKKAPDWQPAKSSGQPQQRETDGAPEHWDVEPWPDPVNGATLLDALVSVITRYMFLPEHAAEAVALWVLHAWTIDASDISPFLVVTSPTKQCGKTTLLTLLYFLTPRSVLASNISAASLFRYIEQELPTLLIDEADSFAKENEELRGILNSGHTRPAARVIRCVGEGKNIKTRAFSTWAPKVIATIRSLADTLMDRSIIVTMRRKSKGKKVERLRLRDADEFAVLRRQALRWATDNIPVLERADPDVPVELDNRPADNWRPLLAIADCADGEWRDGARTIARALSGATDDDGDRRIELLSDIRRVFVAQECDRLGAQDLTNHLVNLEEAPWAEWGRTAKPMSARGLAAMLKPFGIKSDHRKGPRKYHRENFEETWNSYLPPLRPSGED